MAGSRATWCECLDCPQRYRGPGRCRRRHRRPFRVPDAAAEHAALRERGIAVGDLLRWDDVPPMFTFDDPDGNRFYIVEESS